MKRQRNLILIVCVAAIVVAAGLNRSFGQEEQLDPTKLAPDVQIIKFENAFLRVSEERMPPGRRIGKHRHYRGLTIAMADYQMEQKLYPSGQVVHSNRHFGEINWTDTMIHETKNVGTTNQYVVRIELK